MKTPLYLTSQTGKTDVWNDSCSIEELNLSLIHILRGKALEVVSEELEEDPENIREIYKAASEHLENSPEDILEILKRG